MLLNHPTITIVESSLWEILIIDFLHIPSSLPSWISEENIQFFAQKFDETGFTGGLNYYRAIIEGPEFKELVPMLMDGGKWTPASRKGYNLNDAVSRCTMQVYPKSWTAIYLSLENVGMCNLRTEFWARQYLGQQFYLCSGINQRDEYPIPRPRNALTCGKAAGRHTRPL
ncbi:hypothetical protein Syun_026530 [Stephania yunnanensis]|uniref:Plastocyanin-like domain-containing protein n=1 Tax=Stephania yunnanensis TaxID=152371 RepID=A0AAP0EWE3_9MAGN